MLLQVVSKSVVRNVSSRMRFDGAGFSDKAGLGRVGGGGFSSLFRVWCQVVHRTFFFWCC